MFVIMFYCYYATIIMVNKDLQLWHQFLVMALWRRCIMLFDYDFKT